MPAFQVRRLQPPLAREVQRAASGGSDDSDGQTDDEPADGTGRRAGTEGTARNTRIGAVRKAVTARDSSISANARCNSCARSDRPAMNSAGATDAATPSPSRPVIAARAGPTPGIVTARSIAAAITISSPPAASGGVNRVRNSPAIAMAAMTSGMKMMATVVGAVRRSAG